MKAQTPFAPRFTEWLAAQPSSRRQVARNLGITEQTMRNWERGIEPSYAALVRLVEVSGYSGDWWLGLVDERRRP